MSEDFAYETAEVVAPQADELETVEVEVVDPQVEDTETQVEESTAVTEPKQGTDAWFAKNRREKEAAERSLAERTAEIEAIRKQNEELMEFRRTQEEREQEAYIRQFADENGLDYDEVLASVQEEQEKEELLTKLSAKEQREAELLAKIEELTSEKELGNLELQDKEYFRSINVEISAKELGEEFYRLRMNGIPTDIAYEAIKAKQARVEIAPKAGKVDTVPAQSTGKISYAEWNAMPPSEQERLLKTDYDRVYQSQLEWLDE